MTMNNVFVKVAVAAITIAAAGYGAYKLYQKYSGAKIAKQNKFRNRVEDMSFNFDEDEYLEDDDVYYFGQGFENQDDEDDIKIEFAIVDKTADELAEEEEVKECIEETLEEALEESFGESAADELLGSSAE